MYTKQCASIHLSVIHSFIPVQGVVHTITGYMLYTSLTFKYVFDYHHDDVYWCTADIGWITGHSYITYGPLANGATSVLVRNIMQNIYLHKLGNWTCNIQHSVYCHFQIYKVDLISDERVWMRVMWCSLKVCRCILMWPDCGRSLRSTESLSSTPHPLL